MIHHPFLPLRRTFSTQYSSSAGSSPAAPSVSSIFLSWRQQMCKHWKASKGHHWKGDPEQIFSERLTPNPELSNGDRKAESPDHQPCKCNQHVSVGYCGETTKTNWSSFSHLLAMDKVHGARKSQVCGWQPQAPPCIPWGHNCSFPSFLFQGLFQTRSNDQQLLDGSCLKRLPVELKSFSGCLWSCLNRGKKTLEWAVSSEK